MNSKFKLKQFQYCEPTSSQHTHSIKPSQSKCQQILKGDDGMSLWMFLVTCDQRKEVVDTKFTYIFQGYYYHKRHCTLWQILIHNLFPFESFLASNTLGESLAH